MIKKGEEKLPKNSSRVFFSAVCPHRPGSLVELLQIIAKHGINMTKIESRPVKNRPGDYRFFIEADCDLGSQEVKEMISAQCHNGSLFSNSRNATTLNRAELNRQHQVHGLIYRHISNYTAVFSEVIHQLLKMSNLQKLHLWHCYHLGKGMLLTI